MARTVKEAVDNAAPNQKIEEEEEEFTPDDIAMESIVSTLIDEAQSCVRIFRVGKHGKDLTFIDEISPGDFNLGMLKQPPYNGGTFRVYGIVNGKIAGSRILKVDLPPVIEPRQNSGDMSVILAAIQEQGKQTQLAILEMAKALAPQPKQESKSEWLQELVVLKGLFDRPTPPPQQNGIDGSINMLKQILEVKSMLGEGGDSTSPLLTVGMKLLEKMPNIIPQQSPQEIPVQQSIPEQPPIIPQFSAPSPPLVQPIQMETEPMTNSMMMDLLINAAEKKASISWWSDKIAENLPEDLWNNLANDNWFDELVKIEPRIEVHKEWITSVRNKIINDYDLTPTVEPGTNIETDPAQPKNDTEQSP